MARQHGDYDPTVGAIVFLGFAVIALLILLGSLSSCGYHVPKDQCVGKGTECHGEQGDTKDNTSSTGERGPQGIPGPIGPAGPSGPQGVPGARGEAGSSCTTASASNGATINCDDGTTVVILNGVNGTNGSNGQTGQTGAPGADAPASAYSIVEAYDPCGDQGGYDEILLRTAGGKWIAHFSGQGNNFLTVLTPGTYVTTDGLHCYFTLNNAGQITGEHN